ncbi:hypothetical protein TBLA_0A10010 [Henningerozyma blattae CBS 6284]|uniref:Peroxisomal-coenzyme A synthetase n=1 Tax=Henningerozyma blattae (strain ATCC 34711 / CBS 6284 / DSM 70876 / NBRC 10599 / NRRL Y-10934 / UCD 77-7) TaxID=1071380 RepID=I2GXC9_HENB6|nr:hypothetical protein TBLA_0A10010 [Tetrapisispora blattae CBS 6284]CCH58781.1 hypothetical protein TBLA_0A10010 [Tetrapisispora blattae CBS 6284]
MSLSGTNTASFNDTFKVSDNVAVIIPDTNTQVTYRDLSHMVGHFQQVFKDEKSPLYDTVQRQDSVAIYLKNGLEFIVSFLGATMDSKIGAPLNPQYKSTELAFYLNDLKSKVICVPQGTTKDKKAEVLISAKKFDCFVMELYFSKDRFRIDYDIFAPNDNYKKVVYSSLNNPIYINNDTLRFPGFARSSDVALILHTSGTTSKPKTVPLLHLNIIRSTLNISNTYKLTENDRSYVVMPLFHVHGLIGVLLSTFRTQGSVVVPERFSAKRFWQDFIEFKCNWFSCVPTISMIMLNMPKPKPFPYIRFIRSCSSPLAPAIFEKLEKEFQTPVLEAYAMTEASHQMTSNNLPPGKRKPGTVGQPQGVQVYILDDNDNILPPGKIGEVSIRGENVTLGYANNPKANKENFTKRENFFRTGDQGYIDNENFVVLTGRIKELINRGGEKISPVELDGIMLENEKINEAVCFGMDDMKYGQIVEAAVVLKPGCTMDYNEFKKYMATKVAPFKIPSRVYFVDKLPKTATGKLQRLNIAKTFAAKNRESKL